MNYVDSLNLFGVEAKEIPCIKSTGAPTNATQGGIGSLYMDTRSGKIYKCVRVSNSEYHWVGIDDAITMASADLRQTLGRGYSIFTSDDFEQGNCSKDIGFFNSDYRIRLKRPIWVRQGTTVSFTNPDNIWWVCTMYDDSNCTTYLDPGEWNKNATYTAPCDGYLHVVLAIAHDESATIAPSDFTGSVTVTNSDRISELEAAVGERTDYAKNGYYTFTNEHFEKGGYSDGDRKHDESRRIRLKTPIKVNKGAKIVVVGDIHFLLWLLDGEDVQTATVVDSFGWCSNQPYTATQDGYVYMTLATAHRYDDCTVITPTDFTGEVRLYVDGVIHESIEDLAEKIENIDRRTRQNGSLYLSEFIQGSTTPTGHGTSTQRLSMKDCVVLPYGHKTVLRVNINSKYVVGVRAGRLPTNLNKNKYWYKNGDIITFEDNDNYYRIIIARPDDVYNPPGDKYYDITLDELETIDLSIDYWLDEKLDSSTPVARNVSNLETLVNARNVLSASAHGGIDQHPVVFHISDLHGDRERLKNALKMAEYCDAAATIMSGDMVANKPAHGLQWMHELFADYSGVPVVCTGNHDVDDSAYTDADVYSYMMAPSAEKLQNTTGTTYYHVDIANKKLRVIVVDLYQYGATTRSNTHMTSEQLSFICNALSTTPSGYGVFMVAHTPCVDLGSRADANYSTFFQSLRKYGHTHYDISGAPIYDIVDAFIARTSINKTYTQTGTPSSITASADFSGVDSSVEFVAHLTGHIHEDTVCYLPTTSKQLMLNICCGIAVTGGSSYPYLADDCDVTRVPYDKTQDAVNAYVIDRTNKCVKIVRIGGTKTYDMKTREYMSIPYAD